MIARIQGRVVHIEPSFAVVETGGVGYQVFITTSMRESLSLEQEASFHIYTQVREDAIQLYGFASWSEREAFEILLGVTKLGTRTAMATLSTMSVGQLVDAVAREDLSSLRRIPGVGPQLGRRMLLELGGKLPLRVEPISLGSNVVALPPPDPLPLALAQLGFRRSEIHRAVVALAGQGKADASPEERLRLALRLLGERG